MRRNLWRFVLLFWRAYWRFVGADGWAIASHMAMSSLMALFPFLIFVTAIAAFFDMNDVAKKVVELVFSLWPERVAGPIAREVQTVLTVPRTDYLAFGILLSIYLASNGVEALRIGLNRTYGMKENRYWVLIRLESIGFVIVGALAMMTLSLFVILGPVIWQTLVLHFTVLAPFTTSVLWVKWSIEIVVLSSALLAAHLWLPAGRRQVFDVLPGIVTTLIAWMTGGAAFAAYLANFANYASTYAGLASVMTALVFLYLIAAILLFGGALNQTWAEMSAQSEPGRQGHGNNNQPCAEHLNEA